MCSATECVENDKLRPGCRPLHQSTPQIPPTPNLTQFKTIIAIFAGGGQKSNMWLPWQRLVTRCLFPLRLDLTPCFKAEFFTVESFQLEFLTIFRFFQHSVKMLQPMTLQDRRTKPPTICLEVTMLHFHSWRNSPSSF